MGQALQITTIALSSGERAFLQSEARLREVSVNQLVRNAIAGLQVSGMLVMNCSFMVSGNIASGSILMTQQGK